MGGVRINRLHILPVIMLVYDDIFADSHKFELSVHSYQTGSANPVEIYDIGVFHKSGHPKQLFFVDQYPRFFYRFDGDVCDFINEDVYKRQPPISTAL